MDINPLLFGEVGLFPKINIFSDLGNGGFKSDRLLFCVYVEKTNQKTMLLFPKINIFFDLGKWESLLFLFENIKKILLFGCNWL
mgnify:CR=1 FL=1